MLKISNELLAQNEQLKEENRLLKQGEEDARSGAKKQIDTIRALEIHSVIKKNEKQQLEPEYELLMSWLNSGKINQEKEFFMALDLFGIEINFDLIRMIKKEVSPLFANQIYNYYMKEKRQTVKRIRRENINEKTRERIKFLREHNICIYCQKVKSEKSYCDACATKYKLRNSKNNININGGKLSDGNKNL